jgi:hypothetical protein
MDAPSLRATRARHVAFFVIIALLTTMLVACGGNSDDDGDSASDVMPAAAATESGGATAPTGESASEPGQMVSTDGDVSTGGALQQGEGWQQRIIRTANVTLSVVDDQGGVGNALESVRLMATAKGGYVFSSSSYVEQERQFAQITIQVPVDQFDATMNELRSAPFVDEVVREESSSQDVSEEYVDNESRLNALQETQRRFLALLSEAETIEDILRLEQELTDLRAQIETIQGRQNYLDQVTSFSTISVALQPSGVTVRPQTADSDGFSLTSIAERAWDHSSGVIEALLVVAITLAIVGTAILPFALIVWFAYRVYRNRFRGVTS